MRKTRAAAVQFEHAPRGEEGRRFFEELTMYLYPYQMKENKDRHFPEECGRSFIVFFTSLSLRLLRRNLSDRLELAGDLRHDYGAAGDARPTILQHYSVPLMS